MRTGVMGDGRSSLASYTWSSYPEYLKPARKRTGFVGVDRVLDDLGLQDCARDRRQYGQYMERRGLESLSRTGRAELESEWKDIRRGWYLGSEVFREKVQGLVEVGLSGKASESYSGGAARAHDEKAAAELLKVGLAEFELMSKELITMRKLDVRKQVLAWWVQKQTTVSDRWLSESLHMGDSGNISKVTKNVQEERCKEVRSLKKRLTGTGMRPRSED